MIKNLKKTGANYKYHGFTLVELLVVISIIGILISLSIFGLQGARVSSRDAKRKADLEAIRSGIEIYKADCDKYPTSASPALFTLPASTSLNGSGSPSGCAEDNAYITTTPTDPISSQNYSYKSLDGLTYYLCASLEQVPSPLPGNVSNCASCGSGISCNYVVTNP